MALDGWMRQASEGQSVYDQRAAGGQEVIEAW
jgi:hypothetical protein